MGFWEIEIDERYVGWEWFTQHNINKLNVGSAGSEEDVVDDEADNAFKDFLAIEYL